MANIQGTNGNDRLTGTAGDDRFELLIGGSDTVFGGQGFDTVDVPLLGRTLIKTSHNTWSVLLTTFTGPASLALTDVEALSSTSFAGRFPVTVTTFLTLVTTNFNNHTRDGFFQFPGDDGRTSDFLLRDPSGNVIDLVVSNSQQSLTQSPIAMGNAAGWTVIATGDFNADGMSDILMRNSANAVASWSIAFNAFVSSTLISSDATGYRLVGTGDLNDNGTQDVLLQNGNLVLAWMMQPSGSATGALIGTATGYTVDSPADINGDGTTDIVMHDAAGNLVAWIMSGGQVSTGVFLGNLAGYTVTGAADFNGDGTTDLLLRHDASGYMVDLIMHGGAIQASNLLLPSAGFTQVGLGDYNGDGTADVAWQQGGTLAVWNMSNGVYASTSVVSTTLNDYIVFG